MKFKKQRPLFEWVRPSKNLPRTRLFEGSTLGQSREASNGQRQTYTNLTFDASSRRLLRVKSQVCIGVSVRNRLAVSVRIPAPSKSRRGDGFCTASPSKAQAGAF